MADLGQAYVQIVPSAQGIGGKISSLIDGEATSAGTEAGGKLGEGILNTCTSVISGGAGLITGAVSEIVSLSSETASAGDTIDKQSQKLGLSAKAYQEWDFVLNHAGTSMSSMGTGLKTLTNKMDDAKNGSEKAQEMFKKLGISTGELKKMTREDLFAAAIKGFQKMGDSTERAALANDLFGRSGQELTPLFNTTNKETQDMIKNVNALGGVMSDEAVSASANYADRLLDMNSAFDGVKNSLGGVFIPLLADGMEAVAKFVGDLNLGEKISQITPYVSSFGTYFTQAFDLINQAIAFVTPYVTNFINTIMTEAPKVWTAIQPAIANVQSAFGTIITALQPVFNLVGKLVVYVANLAKRFITTSNVTKVLKGILSGVAGAFRIVSSVIKTIINVIKTVITTVRNVMTTFGRFKTTVVTTVGGIWQTIKTKFGQIRTAITTPIKTAINIAKGAFNSFKSLVTKPFNFLSGLKIPKISISGGEIPYGIGGKGKKPSISVKWNAEGGILDTASIIGYGVGEAGAEAIVPLDTFWNKLDNKLNQTASAGGGAGIVTIMLDGSVIAKSTINYINGQVQRYGTSPLAV